MYFKNYLTKVSPFIRIQLYTINIFQTKKAAHLKQLIMYYFHNYTSCFLLLNNYFVIYISCIIQSTVTFIQFILELLDITYIYFENQKNKEEISNNCIVT